MADHKNGHQLSLLPETPFDPKYPNPRTLPGKALASLLRGEHLRQVDWLDISWRLAAVINELVELGWPVIAVPVSVGGRERPIADYSLPQSVLDLTRVQP